MPPLTGRRLWRSTQELAADPEFLARAAAEFPSLAPGLDGASRRRVLQLMGAVFALSGLSACDSGPPGGLLIPAVRNPPNIVPGLPNEYATAHVHDGYALGTVVTHNMGRPFRVQGNPHHPSSLGAADPFSIAEVLDFYDPDREFALSRDGMPADHQSLAAALIAERARLGEARGAGLRILTGTLTSPTLARQLDALLVQYPEARWHQWQPISRDNVARGANLAYGAPLELVAHLDRADVILAIDSDLLSSAPGWLRYARDYTTRRNPTRTQRMSRLYVVESSATNMGAIADNHLVAGPTEAHRFMLALAAGVLNRGAMPPDAPNWANSVIADLMTNRGRAFVHVGPDQPPETHALVHAINEALGGRNATYELVQPIAHAVQDQAASLGELVHDMHAGRVGTLVIIDQNPLFAAPAGLGFADALKRVPLNIALSVQPNETTSVAQWSIPMKHPWETWSDARGHDGTATIMQPQAMPLFSGHGPGEMLMLLGGPTAVTDIELVQETWKPAFSGSFPDNWREALAKGVVPGTVSARADTPLRPDAAHSIPPAPPQHALSLVFRPDPALWDGRHANNPWLQELPRPITKLTWDNPLHIAPALASKFGLANGDNVQVKVGRAAVTAPVWIVPGQAPDVVTAPLGGGRTQVGSVGQGAGVNYYPLTGSKFAPTFARAEGHTRLASTVHHNALLEADDKILKHGTLADFQHKPDFAHNEHQEPHLYRWVSPGPVAWGMSIDLNRCIGCNACVIACQSENNIPTVGKEQVYREREMFWLRIDLYHEGGIDNPDKFFEPVLCMHCEQAPCEIVCPVMATNHDSEGLNLMIYNRCIGTRFCSNNCPYKVRRFNFYGYGNQQPRPPASWNPEVTVRGRGVMEKCTYCVQRIAAERIAADRENRSERNIRTACQQACPAQVFTFGNLRNLEDEVVKRKASPLDFAMLEDQNTHPRTTYEAVVRNPNPDIGDGAERT
jgi:molybdopterin-containing oxidoreductase family iron-sulfur binding subunit